MKRALHFVFKVANRQATIDFYRKVLGMKILRHEEFEKGCEAACNGPYDGRWSKTMVGFGAEDNHFVVELTYNYGIKNYKLGDDFQNIQITSEKIITNARENSYKFENLKDGNFSLSAPGGYQFVVNETQKQGDPVTAVCLAVSNLKKSVEYWQGLLGMELYEQNEKSALLGFSKEQCSLRLVESPKPIDHAEAFGRIAFSCPSSELKGLEEKMKQASTTILTPFISLDTPGKATVQVVILADPDGHEICFVGDEGFRELSQVDPQADDLLNKAMENDKSDEWFQKMEERKKKMAAKAGNTQ